MHALAIRLRHVQPPPVVDAVAAGEGWREACAKVGAARRRRQGGCGGCARAKACVRRHPLTHSLAAAAPPGAQVVLAQHHVLLEVPLQEQEGPRHKRQGENPRQQGGWGILRQGPAHSAITRAAGGADRAAAACARHQQPPPKGLRVAHQWAHMMDERGLRLAIVRREKVWSPRSNAWVWGVRGGGEKRRLQASGLPPPRHLGNLAGAAGSQPARLRSSAPLPAAAASLRQRAGAASGAT